MGFAAQTKSLHHDRILSDSMAQALRRRLRWDIHDGFFATSFALDRQVSHRCGRQQPQHGVLATGRAEEASLICLYFTTA